MKKMKFCHGSGKDFRTCWYWDMKDQEPCFGHAVFEILLDNQEKLNMDLALLGEFQCADC